MGLIRETFREFLDDDCPRMAAALSYYTVFSLPPLLILLLTLAGIFLDPARVQEMLQSQIGGIMGPEGAGEIRTMLESAEQPGNRSGVAALLGIAALLFGATGAFAQLQNSLNAAWKVKPDPNKGGLKNFILKRVLSFGMILGVGFLLLVSLALSALLSAFGDVLAGFVPGGASELVLHAINLGVSLLVITALFAAIFKILPDARIGWRDVGVGALTTALLFVLGKFAIGLYLGRSDPGSAFGAAGSLAIILVWIYYSSMILLLGAEFTHTWATRHGGGIKPEKGAVRVEKAGTR
ncbi:MAG: YihY/virulence factor BrkB family protein [Gemmatimonadota bacterium]|nr:YihY/virulence factor BrkB family protein [Gemmatimonadota bacterium]